VPEVSEGVFPIKPLKMGLYFICPDLNQEILR
jgi:hypothetical protein